MITHSDLVHEQATGRSLHGLPAEGARLAPQLLLASLAKRVAARSQRHQGAIFLTNTARAHEAGTIPCTSICGPAARSFGKAIPGRFDCETLITFSKVRAPFFDNHKTAEAMVLQSLQQRLAEGLSIGVVLQNGHKLEPLTIVRSRKPAAVSSRLALPLELGHLLGRPLLRHPAPRVQGALGQALREGHGATEPPRMREGCNGGLAAPSEAKGSTGSGLAPLGQKCPESHRGSKQASPQGFMYLTMLYFGF